MSLSEGEKNAVKSNPLVGGISSNEVCFPYL